MLQPSRKSKAARHRTGIKDMLREEAERLNRVGILDAKLYAGGTRLTVRVLKTAKPRQIVGCV